MIPILRNFVKSIPTLILSLALSVAVWISAINSADPIQQCAFPRQVPIERVGLSTSLVIPGSLPNQVSVTLSAPKSICDRMTNDGSTVRAWIDLSGLEAGTHNVPVNIQPLIQPSKRVSSTPNVLSVTLEQLVTKELPIRTVQRGEPAVGFQAEPPKLSQDNVTVSGPVSLVDKIKDVRVTIDLTQVSDNINRSLNVQVVDGNEAVIEGLTVDPTQVTVNQPITQRGGYRNVVVKVASTGQVSSGYRLTNISVFPPTVTVFSSNPLLVERLPGFVETSPLDLTGVKDDIDIRLPLNLPDGVEVVGDQNVLVQVGVAAIEGSVTITGLPIQVEGLSKEYQVRISPETVDVIISGPLPLLDRLTEQNIKVYLDLSGVGEGTYQFAPKVTLSIAELQVNQSCPAQ